MALGATDAIVSTTEAFWIRGSGTCVHLSLQRSTLGALFVTLVVIYFLAQAQHRKRLPPGPWPWPVVGNLHVMASAMPHRALEKLAAKYGGIMFLRLGSRPCVIVSTAAAAKEIFRQSNDANVSSRPEQLFAEVISDNYRTMAQASYGPYWRQLRRFSSSELFSPKRHASYQGARQEELHNMMTILVEQSATGEAINVKSWLFEFSANVMTRMLINKRYFGIGGASQEEKDEIQHLFVTLLRLFMVPVISDFVPSLSFITKLQGQERLFKDCRDDAVRVVGKMMDLEKHRERAKERGDNDDDHVPDFVDMISTEPLDNGKPLPDRIMTLMLLEFLVGGTETQSTTAEWAMAELMVNPSVMKQAREELDAVVGCGRLMQESDIPNLPFLQAIMKESFRLHPPAPLAIPRVLTQAAEAWGYEIPAETRVIVNVRAIGRDPNVYQNPEEFDPHRFVDRPEVNHLSGFDFYELIPFGAGRRMCPGFILGNTMVHLMLGNLIHSYDWSLSKDQSVESFRRDNMAEIFGLTVCRKEPLVLLAKPRNNVASCSRAERT